eukprot:2355765-Amphidinium_carterae.1
MRRFRIIHTQEPGCCEQHDGDEPAAVAPPDEDDLVTPTAPSTVRRRIRGKQPPPPEEKDDLMEQVCWITNRLRPDKGAEWTHPHRALEEEVKKLAKAL